MLICEEEHGKQIAALIREKKDALIASWERSVLEDPYVPEASRLPEPTLRDDIPHLIERLASALELNDASPSARGGRDFDHDRVAAAHARQRLAAGYTLEAALCELSHFRNALADLLYGLAVLPTRSEFRSMSVTIDETMVIVAARIRDAEQARIAATQERFVAILGHDLRNPLNAITISADALLHRSLSEREAACVGRIARAAGRMARMIGDIYEFASARFGRGGIKLNMQRSSIVDLCAEAIDEMRLVHDARSIVFDPREDAQGTWDRGRILRVLANLLGNALAYSPPDTQVCIGVIVRGGRALVTVHNEGEPIEATKLPTIFEPFERADTAFRKSDGLGLGLFIAREITRAHGGEIRVESAVGRGTSLTVELPLEGLSLGASFA
jgi:signal transduction histidine kinase